MEDPAKELERCKQDLDSFIYVASHDLKTPLRAISAMAQFVREDFEDKLDKDALESLEEIFSRSMRMNKLIEAMLEYYKVGKSNLGQEEISSLDIIKNSVEALAIDPNIQVEIVNEKSFPLIKYNDIDFDKIVTNILKNAQQHAKLSDGGSIIISYQKLDQVHQFCIEDNGCGIDPEQHERIFLIFQSLSATDKIKNVGMGLTIARKIIEHHGGIISIESEIDKGTKFSFTIPKS